MECMKRVATLVVLEKTDNCVCWQRGAGSNAAEERQEREERDEW